MRLDSVYPAEQRQLEILHHDDGRTTMVVIHGVGEDSRRITVDTVAFVQAMEKEVREREIIIRGQAIGLTKRVPKQRRSEGSEEA